MGKAQIQIIKNQIMTHRLKKFYIQSIRPQLKEQLGYSNFYAIPKLEKIVVHRGIGAATQNQRLIDSSLEELASITSQKGVVTTAKKSIATFKLRKNMPVGIAITLRNDRMFAFLDRLRATEVV